jgi:hypothetical protein
MALTPRSVREKKGPQPARDPHDARVQTEVSGAGGNHGGQGAGDRDRSVLNNADTGSRKMRANSSGTRTSRRSRTGMPTMSPSTQGPFGLKQR